MGFAILILDAVSRWQTARYLWRQRSQFWAVVVTLALPPWAQVLLFVLTAVLFIWAIYELQTRPPLILHSERRTAVGQHWLDLEFGRVDLDITPEELMDIHAQNSGIAAAEQTNQYLHKSLKVTEASFLDIFPRGPNSYEVHLKCGKNKLVFVDMVDDNNEHLKELRAGDLVTLRGRPVYINATCIKLVGGQFIESRHHVSENYSTKPMPPPRN